MHPDIATEVERWPLDRLIPHARKPVALVVRAICNSSKSQDLALDPFDGAGTMLIAAGRTGLQAGSSNSIRSTAT
jgi:DNA modification methylase